MLLAKTKLKSSKKVEYTAGLTLNLMFLWLVVQCVYYFFVKSSLGGIDIFNFSGSLISFLIAYFLFSDNGYSEKHIGTLEWYKNTLHIKNKYVIETCSVMACIFFALTIMVLLGYLLALVGSDSRVVFNSYFVGVCLYIIIVNIYSFLTAMKMNKIEIFSDDLLNINNITELSQKRRSELKETVMNKIKYEGCITRKQISSIIEYVEKGYNRYKNKERGLYDDFMKSK